MDKHYFLSVCTYKSNNMGNELSKYVYEKYNHVVVSSDDIFDVKYDIQMKIRELEEQNKRCKPFRFEYRELKSSHNEIIPYIVVKPDTYTEKVVFYINAVYIRNAILEIQRP